MNGGFLWGERGSLTFAGHRVRVWGWWGKRYGVCVMREEGLPPTSVRVARPKARKKERA